ncbi:asparagine synthetase B [Taibaiella sp. KBW10]|uniref:asparagine synthetase B n=1 Tax=Taibaiella sp. KBW10 TaxID=2153357 RepID=UPI000F59A09F|nr:asparagine synthetase B [Taibaiella sp. KBW10]RQO30713.1 asparagine synthetase B [Taibaiella sp. KBW10]
MKKSVFVFLCLLAGHLPLFAAKLYIPMNADDQSNHLKAYGIAFVALQSSVTVDWLLNYDGGAFAMDQNEAIERLCKVRGVDYKVIPDGQYLGIVNKIVDPNFNGDIIKLEKPPRIAVYTPTSKLPWDDAVTMALTYAEIPYDKVYDDELMGDKLNQYDWLHLHHEDFTGQFGKFWANYRMANWYIEDVKTQEASAHKHGFKKVSQLKLAVAQKIRDFVAGGGYLFAMCSATDSYDIALSAEGVDICEQPFDGDPMDPNAQQKLNYDHCFAFKDFILERSPTRYEYSSIDNTDYRQARPDNDYFSLFTFSAKFDPVPSMLTQNHTTTVKGFVGQTTAFRKEFIKSNVIVMGENKAENEVRYLHGEYGKGTFTFYGGHDPEDYQHAIGDPPTDLSLHPKSPGYRLILNNVLFPAAKKKPRKT